MGARSILCLGLLVCFWPDNAYGHVKWFADYNLVCPPRSSAEILTGEYFLGFCLFVGIVMFATAFTDRRLVYARSWPSRVADALTDIVQPHVPLVLRLGVCIFFVVAASYGGFILTPELATHNSQVFVVQVAIAVLVLLPRTAFLAGCGIVGLYAYAIAEFGVYHLLDYPIFLGVAAFLIMDSLYGREMFASAHNTLRLCTGVTLLWAAIEKFAFPEWSFVLLEKKPAVAFGFEPEFYMVAAGFVEFCCAWLLITGMLSARAAAFVLLLFFVSAVYWFGLIDAIGHSVIIIVLVLLVLSRNPISYRLDVGGPVMTAAAHTAMFFGALLLFVGLYCGGHYLSYGPYQRLFQCLL